MKAFAKFIILILSLLNLSCSYNRTLLKDKNRFVTNQFEYLKKESNVFLAKPEQKYFENKLFDYLKEYKNYNFFSGRETPILLSPIIINKNNEAIAFIAVRIYDNSNQDLDYVKFISAKFENNNWIFKLKQGHSFSFSYIDKTIPRLTNEEIAEHTIRNLMLQGFFKDNFEDKSIFDSSWNAFK